MLGMYVEHSDTHVSLSLDVNSNGRYIDSYAEGGNIFQKKYQNLHDRVLIGMFQSLFIL